MSDSTCGGPKCCTDAQKCCGDHCCKKGEDCCGPGCCPDGKTCAVDQQKGTKVCCIPERTVRTRFGTICCRPGDIAFRDRCCPGTNPPCNECDPPCRAGESCRDGFCLEV